MQTEPFYIPSVKPHGFLQPHDSAALLLQDIEKALEPVLYMYKQRRRPGEALGDFTARIGFDALKQYGAVSVHA